MRRYTIEERGRRRVVLGHAVGADCFAARPSPERWILDHIPSGAFVALLPSYEAARGAARDLRAAFGERLDSPDFAQRCTAVDRVRFDEIVVAHAHRRSRDAA